MLGWILVFALMSILGAFFTLAADLGSGFGSIKFATILFSGLFFTCILTRIVRRQM
jgi:hypothetical protein